MNIDDFLSIPKDKSILLYLSSGNYNEKYYELPYDYIILCDKYAFQSCEVKDEKILLINYDNNKLIRKLISSNIKIDCFVGINDGCREAGNYECINTSNFFARLSPILKDECLYITDHKSENQFSISKKFYDVPFSVDLIENPDFVNKNFTPYYSPYIRTWNLKRNNNLPETAKLGKINCSVINQSIWDRTHALDCIFIKPYPPKPYLNGVKFNVVDLSPYVNKSFVDILSYANKNHLDAIGITPYLEGNYSSVLEAIENWNLDFPKSILFFHMNSYDMEIIYNYFKKV